MRVAGMRPVSLTVTACLDALGIPSSTYYQRRKVDAAAQSAASEPTQGDGKMKKNGAPPRCRLSLEEESRVLELMRSPALRDQTPYEIYGRLVDEGEYLCHPSTMYRVLNRNQEVKTKRDEVRRVLRPIPKLKATGPNQVWTWDISKLKGAYGEGWYMLYAMMDIFSRKVVGWRVEYVERAEMFVELMTQTVGREGIRPQQLVMHSDNGAAMTAHVTVEMLHALGVERSHSRPRTSNDNPFIESLFKTFKNQPKYPRRSSFEDIEDARGYCREFFDWYNNQHYHRGIALLTPNMVHHGQAPRIIAERQLVVDKAFAAHPERFGRAPKALQLPPASYINGPDKEARKRHDKSGKVKQKKADIHTGGESSMEDANFSLDKTRNGSRPDNE